MTQILAISLLAVKAIASLLFESDCTEEFIRAQRAKALVTTMMGR